jgi:hypothetical protein
MNARGVPASEKIHASDGPGVGLAGRRHRRSISNRTHDLQNVHTTVRWCRLKWPHSHSLILSFTLAVRGVEGYGNLHFFFSTRLEALMDPNVDCDSEQEARDCTTATVSSPFVAVPAVEPKSMDYEEWRVRVRSFCGRYSPEGVDPKTFAGSIRP